VVVYTIFLIIFLHVLYTLTQVTTFLCAESLRFGS
jgi:hypothetical protein